MKLSQDGKTLLRVENSNISANSSYKIPEGVTVIGKWAFHNCTRLTQISTPNSLTTIGESAFCDCTSLKQITIPNSVISIGESAFRDCTSLTQISIPSSVTSIGDFAFYNCSSLKQICIPSSITSMGNWTLYGCTKLEAIFIDSLDDHEITRIIRLLPDALKQKVVSKEITAKILEIQQKQLDRITNIPESNPLYRTSKQLSLFPLPKEMIGEVANHVTNLFELKAKFEMAKISLPLTDEGMAHYETELKNIVDDAIVRACSGITQKTPVAANPDNGSVTPKNS